jgi:hypothetical protein
MAPAAGSSSLLSAAKRKPFGECKFRDTVKILEDVAPPLAGRQFLYITAPFLDTARPSFGWQDQRCQLEHRPAVSVRVDGCGTRSCRSSRCALASPCTSNTAALASDRTPDGVPHPAGSSGVEPPHDDLRNEALRGLITAGRIVTGKDAAAGTPRAPSAQYHDAATGRR